MENTNANFNANIESNLNNIFPSSDSVFVCRGIFEKFGILSFRFCDIGLAFEL